MLSVHLALVVVAWGIALAWLLKMVEAAVGLRRVPNLLANEYDVAVEGEPSLAVIVPARNEAGNLERCLGSVQWADEVWVADADWPGRSL